MTKNQFLKLLKDMKTEMPDNSIRKENLERYFVENGYSIMGGYKQVSYFYNEMVKAVNGEESIFIGGNNIITKIDGYFALLDGFQVNLKLKNELFESMADLFSESIYTYNFVKEQLIPFGYYYNLPIKLEYTTKERSKSEIENWFKIAMEENDTSFLKVLEFKKTDKFLDELEIHYQWFNERSKEMSSWLEHTRKLIENKFDDRYILFEFKKWLKSKGITKVESEIKSIDEETNTKIIEYSPNFWNEETYKLFIYLVENYQLKAKRQKFVNIWFYLTYYLTKEYQFFMTKDDYRKYVSDNHNFNLLKAKMNEPSNMESQKIVMGNHFLHFKEKATKSH